MVETPNEINIRLDPDQTVTTISTTESTVTSTLPTQFAQTPEGIVIGKEAKHVGGQTGIDQGSLVDPEDETRSIDVENQPLAIFLSGLRRRLGVSDFDPDSNASNPEVKSEYSEAPLFPTAISVPGAYDAGDCRAVAAAAESAGFPNVHVLRRPASLAIAPYVSSAAPKLEPGANALLLDIDSQLLSVGVLHRTDDGSSEMLGRINIPGHGSQTWSRSLAEYVFEQVGETRDANVEYTDDALAEVAGAIRQNVDAMDQAPVSNDINLELCLRQGARLTAGQHTLDEHVTVDFSITPEAQHSVLEEYTREILATLSVLFDGTDLDRESIDQVYVHGDGSQLTVVQDSIQGFFDQEIVLSGLSQLPPSKLVSEKSGSSDSPDITETIDCHVGVRARQDDRIVSRRLTVALQPHGTKIRVPLKPIANLQQSGRVELELIHPLTGEPRSIKPILITGIPVAAEGEVELVLEPTPDGSNNMVEVRAATSDSEDNSSSPVANLTSEDDTQWLAFADDDPAMTLDLEDVAEYESDKSYTTKLDSSKELSKSTHRNIAEAVHDLRADIWEWTIQKNKTLEPDHAKTLLRDLDQSLSRYDVEFFSPDIGDDVNSKRHFIRAKRDSEATEGSIIEVLKPGLVVDDEVIQRADVVVAGE